MTVTELTTEKLADLISKRHTCFVQLRDLGRKQAELIAHGDMGPLLRLLSAKNQLIVAVQAIEQELNPYHAQDPEQRSWSSEHTRVECGKQAAQCRELLEEVMQMEQQNEQRMTLRRDQVASRLQAAQAASTARGAYQAQQRTTVPRAHITTSGYSGTQREQRLDLHSEV